MPYITVDDEQAEMISSACGEIVIRDRNGKHLGYVMPGLTAEDAESIAIAKQRLASDEPRYTTKQVLEHLRSLEQA